MIGKIRLFVMLKRPHIVQKLHEIHEKLHEISCFFEILTFVLIGQKNKNEALDDIVRYCDISSEPPLFKSS